MEGEPVKINRTSAEGKIKLSLRRTAELSFLFFRPFNVTELGGNAKAELGK